MRWFLIVWLGCSSAGPSKPAPISPADRRQTVAEGIAVLCASSWNGELYGTAARHWVPDSLHEAIKNDEVVRLIGALTSPDAKRPELFDGFLAENHVVQPTCPFRDRLPSWPRELPVAPPPE